MHTSILILVTTLAIAAPNHTNLKSRQSRIVGGREALPHSIPWQVALHVNVNFKISLCGGTVISTNAVLTAAHCLEFSSRTTVIAGAHNRNTPSANQQRRTITAAHYRLHPSYDTELLTYDIAVIAVTEPWIFNQYVQPVRLPIGLERETFLGETATVSGWGRTSNNGGSSNVLRIATVPVISNSICSRAFGSEGILESTLCTGTVHGQGSCGGDSGGPLTVSRPGDNRPVLIGIISHGHTDGCVGTWPTVMTRVTSFLDWIRRSALI